MEPPETPPETKPEEARAEQVIVSSSSVGTVTLAPPTFLERWGVYFLAVAGSWILLVGILILVIYLWKGPAFPNPAAMTADQFRDAMAVHNAAEEQWRASLTTIFDLLVTKTVLPLCTLLLGYLFGKGKTSS